MKRLAHRFYCTKHGKICFRCVLFTLGFPVEHVIWEKAPVFSLVTKALGL
jgi:hypothetical protein